MVFAPYNCQLFVNALHNGTFLRCTLCQRSVPVAAGTNIDLWRDRFPKGFAMKEKNTLRWVAAICIFVFVSASFASDRPEPNAFLNKKADTVSQLISAVRNDPAVADRYARHFGKTREEVVQLLSGLHLARLNEEGTFLIYSVDDDGVIKAKPQRLKAGTRVFADASGNPILKASCGNALVPGTNAQVASLNPGVVPATETLRTVAVTTPDVLEENVVTGVLTPASPVALMPVMPDTIATGTSNQGFALPAALAALGGAGAILFGGGGSAPVPEPTTVLVMVGALGALALRKKGK
jgi:hypothetical protein